MITQICLNSYISVLFFCFFFLHRHFINIHHLTRLCLIFSGIISCVAGASNSHTCNCNCGDRYSYGQLLDGHHSNSCQPKRAGQLKFTDGRLFVCTGNEWKALQYFNESSTTPNVSYRSKAPNVPYRSKAPNVRVPYGSKAKPGFSCKDIKTKKGKQNGIYWIRLSGNICYIFYPVHIYEECCNNLDH